MNKLLKKIAALGCVIVAFTAPFSFAGCSKEKEPSPEPEKPPIVQPVETEQEKAEKLYDSLLASMKKGNFTLKNGNETYKFNGDKAEIDGAVYFSENGRDVCITDGVKDFSELSVAAAKNNVVAQFDGVEFDDFDNGVLSGSQADGDKVSVTVSADKIELTVNGHTLTASNIGTTTVNIPTFTEDKTVEKPPVEKTLQEAAAEINAFLSEVEQSKKFTYTKTKDSQETKYSFLNGIMRVEKDGSETIYEEDGEQKYAYSNQNGAWSKDFTDKSIANALTSFENFASTIEGLTWSTYDAQTNQLSGSLNSKNVTANLNGNSVVFKIGDTTVNISKTVENFAKPTAFTDNTIQSEKLWETVDGQRVYNYKLLAQTLEDWIKENDGYLKEITRSSVKSVDKLLTIAIKDNSLEFKTYVTNSNEKPQIMDFEINPAFLTSILTEENNTVSAMKKSFTDLVQNKKYPIRPKNLTRIEVEYTSLDATPEQKTEMEGLTTSVFNKLATEGWITTSWRDEGTKVADLKDAKILFSARNSLGADAVGYDIGTQKFWHQYYLIDNNGQLEWIDIELASSTSLTDAISRVINNTDNLWVVLEPKRTTIDKGNSQIYEDVIATTTKSLNL